jgi:hypothetical protein
MPIQFLLPGRRNKKRKLNDFLLKREEEEKRGSFRM